MKVDRSRVWRGALSALLVSWLCYIGMGWLAFVVLGLGETPGGNNALWSVVALVVLWLTTLPIVSFVAGLICAFFWHPMVRREQCAAWSTWVTLVTFAPMLAGLGGGCCIVLISFLPCSWVLGKGLDCGYKWWPQRAWRAFFGLSNPWERDERERDDRERDERERDDNSP